METRITYDQIERRIYTYYWSSRYEKFIFRYNKNRDNDYYESMKKSIEKLITKN
jgi:hypothetical protein